jgi:hypothetical protein
MYSWKSRVVTLLICSDCQFARGHNLSPYPATMTRAELRAGLDLLPM